MRGCARTSKTLYIHAYIRHTYFIHTYFIQILHIYIYIHIIHIYTHIHTSYIHTYFSYIYTHTRTSHTYFIYIHTCPLSRYHHSPSLLSAQAGPFKASVMFITQVSERCWAMLADGAQCERTGKKAGPICDACWGRLSVAVSVFGIARTTPLLPYKDRQVQRTGPHHADRSEGCMWGI